MKVKRTNPLTFGQNTQGDHYIRQYDRKDKDKILGEVHIRTSKMDKTDVKDLIRGISNILQSVACYQFPEADL